MLILHEPHFIPSKCFFFFKLGFPGSTHLHACAAVPLFRYGAGVSASSMSRCYCGFPLSSIWCWFVSAGRPGREVTMCALSLRALGVAFVCTSSFCSSSFCSSSVFFFSSVIFFFFFCLNEHSSVTELCNCIAMLGQCVWVEGGREWISVIVLRVISQQSLVTVCFKPTKYSWIKNCG